MKSGGLVADELMLRLISNELYLRGWLFGEREPRIMTLNSSSVASDPELSFLTIHHSSTLA